MIARQAYALLMAHANGKEPVRGRTRFQKMMFLLWKGMEGEGGGGGLSGLGFAPHHYGPYSRQLQDDIEGLIGEGMIGEEVVESPAGQYAYRYRVTERGAATAEALLGDPRYEKYGFGGRAYEAICGIKKRVNGMGIRDLLEEVYAEHPEYAQYSRYEF